MAETKDLSEKETQEIFKLFLTFSTLTSQICMYGPQSLFY